MQRTQSLLAKVSLLSLVVGLFAGVRPTHAGEFLASSDTMSRLQASVTANHTVVIDQPSGTTFDAQGFIDVLSYDFGPFVLGGTWATGDFTFNDGSVRTINAVAQGAGTSTVSCADGANNVGVAIDTTAKKFYVMPCGTSYAHTDADSVITFGILGDAPNGTVTNPATGSYTIKIRNKEENIVDFNQKDIQVSIVDSDTVATNATVDPTMTFDIDTATGDSDGGAPYAVALGSISLGAVATSGGSVNSIWMDLETNATNGATVTVINSDATTDLISNSVPTDTISSAGVNTTLNAGTEGYGICVVSATSTSGLAISNVDGNYDGDGSNDGCTASTSDNVVTTPPNNGGAAATLVSNVSAPIVAGRIRVAVKAAISGTTEPHADYVDSLRFIATANF